MTQDMARALTDAGYLTVAEYLRLCEENGWATSKEN
jgi:hypothetical protein